MAKTQTITTNFTAGEQSPRLRARVDIDKYNASAQELYNCVVFRHGGATIRPPTKYIGEVKTSAHTPRLIPFVYSRTDSYVLEFGNFYARFWKNGAIVTTAPNTPYEIVTSYSHVNMGDVDYSQGADTMLMTLQTVQVQALRRYADTNWTIGDAVFSPPPVDEVGDRNADTMTISNVAVGAGRTLTAGTDFFRASDVGRVMSWGGGSALITAVVPGLTATATVTKAFPTTVANGAGGSYPVWNLEGSPQTTCTPSVATPVGATCTLTLLAAGWRPDLELGGVIEINGGLVRITSLGSDTVAEGIIEKVLSGTGAAIKNTWVQKRPVFNATDGYPKTVTFYQQRTWLANSVKYPQTMFGSRTALYFDFLPGSSDEDAVYKTLDSDDVNPIDLLNSWQNIVALTVGGEFEVRGGVEKPITPTNAATKIQTKWGCATVRPEQIGEDLLFVQRGGKTMRAIRAKDTGGFSATDISVFSEHLLRQGIKWMSYQQTPECVLWAGTTDGKLLAITYNIEQNQITFCSGEIGGGLVEWGVTVPEGNEDATYLLVKRTINSVTKRYIEKIDWGNWSTSQEIRNAHDCRMEKTGAASTAWSGFDHLEGETVSVLADDIYVGEFTITAGAITPGLPRAATKVSAGKPYTARIRQQPPEVATASGTSQGQAVSVHNIKVRFHQTIGCKINGDDVPFRQFDVTDTLDQPPAAFTGIKEVNSLGWAAGENELTIEQTQPYPWTVLAIIRDMTVNPG